MFIFKGLAVWIQFIFSFQEIGFIFAFPIFIDIFYNVTHKSHNNDPRSTISIKKPNLSVEKTQPIIFVKLEIRLNIH